MHTRTNTSRKAIEAGGVLVAAAAVLGGPTAQAAPPIAVTVNGSPISFTGTPPVEINGAILVPLRGVFQALGADVHYDAATRVINASKGSSTVVLALGSTAATVNGRLQTLGQPSQTMNGTTLVPLRFVAQALGASVQWVAAANTVQIQTAEPHLATLPAAPGAGPVEGQATGVFTDTNPQTVTVRVNGVNTSVPIGPQTILLRSAPGQAATQVTLGQIQPGDQVRVQRDAAGSALSVTAVYGEVRGTIKSISGKLNGGGRIITLNDGTTVETVPDVPVRMAGRSVSLDDVMANEAVVIRTNPANKQAFGIAVVPPDNPNPTPPASDAPTGPANPALPPGAVSVTINSFTDDAHGDLKPGDQITATLAGTPGGKAAFAIPSVVENVPLRETSPGVYTGSYTVPKGANVSGAAILGSLTVNGVSAPLIQAAGLITIDDKAPKVADFSPSRGASTDSPRPLIYATLSDGGGVGVDSGSVRISLDGTDVTGQTTVTPSFFNMTPPQPLSAGAHQVRVTVADKVGNRESAEWQFTVTRDTLVQSFTSSVTPGQSVGVGETIRFTLNAKPGGQAHVRVGTLAPDVALGEGTPGVYTGEYTVRAGDNLQNAPVSAEFKPAGGETVSVPLSSGLTIAAGPPKAPQITSPPTDDVVAGDTLTVEGRAAPGATVRVSVDYVSKALGGLFAVRGSAGTQDVTADKEGRWKADNLPLSTKSLLTRDRDTVYTVTAVTVSGNGDVSDPAKITVRHG